MTKVITYGTYDLLHYGHIRLLERAKALGDYLIVGVTADDFDKSRGKINVQQSLMERVEAVKATGLADEIIIEEYEGQKIDDILRNDVDIFTVGSDWKGKFDYLNKYCKVVYLDRTEGVSSSEIRAERASLHIGFVGESNVLIKHVNETKYVDGVEVSGIFSKNESINAVLKTEYKLLNSLEEIVDESDALYIASKPELHYEQIKYALNNGKHVLCESPITLNKIQFDELSELAKSKNLILMDAIKTAYSTAYNRLLVLLKSGKIGKIVSVDAVCTSLRTLNMNPLQYHLEWNSICSWGPTALLPVFQILGTDYKQSNIVTHLLDESSKMDLFTKIDFVYDNAVASIKVGKGVKSEGELIISGTEGYVYVPAPWWKTDYFEVRYENPADNKRYFYQLDGEGIRYELVAFLKSITNSQKHYNYISRDISKIIVTVVEKLYNGNITTI